MNRQIIRKRTRAIRRQLANKRISCLVVTKPANVTYTTGFLGDDSWAVVTRSRVYLLTDSRYTEQAQAECPTCKIVDRAGPMAEAVAKLVTKLRSVRTVSIEESTSVAELEQLKRAVKRRLRTAANLIEKTRMVKDESEIAAIKSDSGKRRKGTPCQAARYQRSMPAGHMGLGVTPAGNREHSALTVIQKVDRQTGRSPNRAGCLEPHQAFTNRQVRLNFIVCYLIDKRAGNAEHGHNLVAVFHRFLSRHGG